MRQGQQQHQQQKRMRGRNNNNRKGPNPLSRSYESNGPDVKIRGTAAHIADKYVQLARDATSSGDPISAENYLQHAEHYYRILAAAQPQYPQGQTGFVRADDESRDDEGDEDGNENQANGYDGQQPNGGGYPQQPQPYAQQGGEGGQQRRDYQPREQRDHQPREQREHQPREQREFQPREQREPRPQNNQQNNDQPASGLPAFITGGGGQEAQGGQDRGDGEGPGRNRNRRRFGRYGRNGGPGEQSAPEGGPAPSGEPEIAPGE
jgi:hypothetical protein